MFVIDDIFADDSHGSSRNVPLLAAQLKEKCVSFIPYLESSDVVETPESVYEIVWVFFVLFFLLT